MKKAYYDNKPTIVEPVGDGSMIYHFGIELETIQEKETWSCFEVVIFGAVSGDKLTALVLDAMFGNGIEEKAINDYNAAVLGVLDESYIDSYKAFLVQRKELKDQIDRDCTSLNISK